MFILRIKRYYQSFLFGRYMGAALILVVKLRVVQEGYMQLVTRSAVMFPHRSIGSNNGIVHHSGIHSLLTLVAHGTSCFGG